MDAVDVDDDLINVLFTEKQIQDRLAEMAAKIRDDYEGKDLLLVGVLRGAVMVMADLARTSTGTSRWTGWRSRPTARAPSRSGVVRILKDLDTDITGRHVLIVDEIIDTGLTLAG